MADAPLTQLAPGTLVQVKKSALATGEAYHTVNRESVEINGWLWVVDTMADSELKPAIYHCRSIATGTITSWFDSELNIYKEEEHDC